MKLPKPDPPTMSSMERRTFIQNAAVGTVIEALGGLYAIGCKNDPRATQKRPDNKLRLPPGQRIINYLRPMGGEPGDPAPSAFRLRIHGRVQRPRELTFAELLALPQVEQVCDVHCVTSWSLLDSMWTGVKIATLAELVGVSPSARHVIFEAAAGYTANVRLDEALMPSAIIAHRHQGVPLAVPHGAPARAVIPDLYFWKSAKWITGIYFTETDQPGYWETRGYHNHADPWREERYG